MHPARRGGKVAFMEGNTMKTFTMKIEFGNEAMQSLADVAQATSRIFADFANRTEEATDDAGRIYDYNGNKVGTWSVDE